MRKAVSPSFLPQMSKIAIRTLAVAFLTVPFMAQMTVEQAAAQIGPGPPQFSITKSIVGQSTVVPGSNITYRITILNKDVANGGPSLHTKVIDQIPPGLVFQYGNTGNCTQQGYNVVCTAGTLHRSEGATFDLTFRVDNVCGSSWGNVATVTGDSYHPGQPSSSQTSNNVVAYTTACAPQVTQMSCVESAIVVPESVQAGQQVSVQFTFKNTGTTTIPAGQAKMVFVPSYNGFPALPGLQSVTLGTALAPGQQAIFTNSGLPAPQAPGTYVVLAKMQNMAGQDISPFSCGKPIAVTAPPAADLSIVKTGAQTIQRGHQLFYTITVTNNGPASVNSFTVTDTVPSGLTFSYYNSDFVSCQLNGNTVTCFGSNLAPQQSRSFTLAFDVPVQAQCNAFINNTASVASPVADGNLQNNVSTAQTRIDCPVTTTTLQAGKTGPATVIRGNKVTYTLSVKNTGAIDATNVLFQDQFPGGLTFLPAESSPGCSITGGTVECSAALITPNSTVTRQLTFLVPSYVPCTPLSNVFTTTAANAPAVQSPFVTTTVQCPAASFAISKTDGKTTAQAGEMLTYSITIENTSSVDATNVSVTDTLPQNVTFISASDNAFQNVTLVSWNIATFPAFSTRTLTVTVRVKESAPTGSLLHNVVTVLNQTAFDDTTVQNPSADLQIVKSGPASVTFNDTVSYILTVTNKGPSTVNAFTVSDTFPADLEFTNAGSDFLSCYPQGSQVICQGGNLAPDMPRDFHLNFRFKPRVQTTNDPLCNQFITNQSSVTSTTVDPILANNSASTQAQVLCPVTTTNVTITKTASETVSPNGLVTYAIKVKNTGTIAAQNVQVTDQLPSMLQFENATGASCSFIAGTVYCTVGTLQPNEERTITIQARAPQWITCDSSFTNSASVSASNAPTAYSTSPATHVTCPQASFTISKTDNRSTVQAGEQLTYQITVSNTSNVLAQNITVSDILPDGVTFQSATQQGILPSAPTITWSNLTFQPFETKTFSVTVRVNDNVTNGVVLVNTAKVLSQTATDQTTVETLPQFGCIAIQKEAFNPQNQPLNVIPQFSFRLDNQTVVTNDSQGNARFENVLVGQHTVSEIAQNGWELLQITPANGTVTVVAGQNCAGVTFKNRQIFQGTPALSLEKTGPSSITPGGAITYTVKATNTGTANAQNVVITDTLPSGLTLTSANGCSQNGSTLTCSVGTLTPSQSQSFTITASTNQDLCGTVINNKGYASADTVSQVQSNQVSTTVGACPIGQLALEKTGPSSIVAGGLLTYTVTARNTGNGVLQNVVITDTLPSGLTLTSANGCSQNGSTLTCSVGTLTPNQSQSFTITASTNQDLCGTQIVNKANASADAVSQVQSNQVSTTVGACPIGQLALEKTGPSTATAGSALTYTLTARNTGNGALQNVVITDTLPNGLVFSGGNGCSVNGSLVTCNVGTLNANQNQSYTITVTSALTLCGTQATNKAYASADGVSQVQSNQITTSFASCPQGELAIEKSGPGTVQQGNTFSYTVTVKNNGQGDLQNVVVTDPLSSDLEFVSANDCSLNGSTVTCSVGTLTPNQSRQFTIQVKAKSTAPCNGTITNRAYATATGQSQAQSNQVSTALTCPVGQLLITKSANQSSVQQGGSISYTVTVKNNGQGPLNDVVVTDPLPSNVSFNSASGCSVQNNSVVCNVGTLTAGQQQSFTFSFTVNSAYCGTINNTAYAVANGVSQVSSGNVAVTVQCTQPGNLALSKSGPSTVHLNDTFSYTLTVSNNGQSALQNVQVTDPLPTYVEFLGASDCTANGSFVTCNAGTLNAGQSRTFTIQARIQSSSACSGTARNTATASATGVSSVQSQQVSTFVQCDTQGDDRVSITITDSPDPVRPDHTLTYTLNVRNLSNSSQTIDVRQILPGDVEFDYASSGGTESNNLVRWTNQSFSANQSLTYTVSVRVDPDARDGDTLYTTAYANNEQDSETTRVIDDDDNNDRDLELTITDTPDPVEPCEQLTYRIRLENNGRSDRTVTLRATLDSQTEFDDASDNGREVGSRDVEWRSIRISDGDVEEFDLDVTVDCDAEDNDRLTLSARAEEASDTERTDVEDRGTTRPPSGNITFQKQASLSTAQPGQSVTYTLTIRNNISSDLRNVQVTDTYNAAQLFVQNAGAGTVSGGQIRWNIGTLRRGETRVLTYVGQLNTALRHGETVVNNAQLQTDHGTFNASASVGIIKQVPQTGSSYTGDIDDGSQFLRRISRGKSSGALPIAAAAASFASVGGLIAAGRRFFF